MTLGDTLRGVQKTGRLLLLTLLAATTLNLANCGGEKPGKSITYC